MIGKGGTEDRRATMGGRDVQRMGFGADAQPTGFVARAQSGPRPWTVHLLATLWIAWVAAAVAKAGGDPWPWLWALYVAGVYVLVATVKLRWRLPFLVLLAGFLWWSGSWGGPGPGALPGAAGVPGVMTDGSAAGQTGWSNAGGVQVSEEEAGDPPAAPGASASSSAHDQVPSWWRTTADQWARAVGAILDGRWNDLLTDAQGPLGRGAAVLLAGLTTWVFVRSVERGLIWTWLLAGEMVLALTDTFFVSQAASLVGTVVLGILLAATARGLWWGYWRSFPKRALAAGLALSLTAGGVGLLVPKQPPTWPDPLQWLTGRSTAPLKKIGYGVNDLELGGSFVQDSTIAFTVVAPEATYYRGETRDVYTGHGWAASPSSADNRIFQALLQGGALPWPADAALHGVSMRTVRQSITVENGPLPVVLAAYPLTRVVSVSLNHGGAFRASPSGAWMSFGNLVPGDSYTVESSVPVVVPQGAKQALPADPAGLPPTVRADLQLPPDVPARVVNLAKTITAGHSSVYGKAQALVQYLKSHYRYETQQIPVPRPGQDFVDQFLFESKIGYCDHFSTAMAVMARSVGLPTRWVKGFAPGHEVQKLNSGKKLYTVRNSDAHSWVEVWIPGYGWMPFDPTPSVVPGSEQTPGSSSVSQNSGTGAGSGSGDVTPQTPSQPAPAQPSPSGNGNGPGTGGLSPASSGGGLWADIGLGGGTGRRVLWTGLGLLGIAAAVAGAAFALSRRARSLRHISPETRKLFADPPPRDVGEAVERLQNWYIRRGHPLTRDTTVRDMVQALIGEIPQVDGLAGQLLAALESTLYGQGADAVPPTPGGRTAQAVGSAWREIARMMGVSRRPGKGGRPGGDPGFGE